MKTSKKVGKPIAIILVILLTAFIFSCGGGGSASNPGTTKVTVSIGQSKLASLASNLIGRASSAIPSNVASVSVTVSGSGMDTQQQSVNVSGQSDIAMTFDAIPNGLNRDFFAVAKDASGAILFQGDAKADLDGTPKDITIQMGFVLSGAWSLMHTQQTPVAQPPKGPDFFSLTQTGTTVTFTYIDNDGTTHSGSGSISGSDIQLTISDNTDSCNNPAPVSLTGTVSADGNTITGTYTQPGTSGDCANGETGTWTAAKAQTPSFNIADTWSGFVTPSGGTEQGPVCITFTQTGSFLAFSGDIAGSGILSGNNIMLQFSQQTGGGATPGCKTDNHFTGSMPDGNSASGTFTTSNDCGIPDTSGTWRAVRGACTPVTPPTQGTISGTVTDALTGLALSGVTVTVSQQGTTIATATTATDGTYSLTAASGTYSVAFSTSGYITSTVDNVGIGADSTTTLNAVLSPVLTTGQVRIVLTWDYSKGSLDLDSYLQGPRAPGDTTAGPFQTWYGSKVYSFNEVIYAQLDHDWIDPSNGPVPQETTTIEQQVDGVYNFYVHDFTDGGSTNSTTLSNSSAEVKVYIGNTLAATYNVPTNQTGTVWTVFQLSGNNLTPINTLSSDETVLQSASRSSLSLKKKGKK